MTHLFLLTLDDLPNKWYKIEKACGDTFTWKSIKHNFIKDLSFNFEVEKLKDETKHIKDFFIAPSIQQLNLNKKYER